MRQWVYLGMIGAVCGTAIAEDAATPKIDFNRQIRSILSNNCFHCHGPDEAERQGGLEGLRLDTEAGAFADVGGYSVIVRGKPEESELLRRLESSDASELMPPPETGKKLSEAERKLLRQWIKEGAEFAQHWSYVKPNRPQLPPVKQTSWPANEIDFFILSRLEEENLTPSPEANRYSLIRRLSLDLTGLPPTWDEVHEFVNDERSNAYELLVDRLLAKQSYGEHWARMWLDLARYADSAGYADDPPRTIWAYRDYVIRSLNANKPFDQFTIEQIAGDLLPNPTKDQLTATAFHRNTLTNNEGGTNNEEFRNVAVVDRVNTTMAVWMGTTMACAQCHSHKYDPITHEEYFQFFAFFNSTADADLRDERPFIPLFSPAQKAQKESWEKEIAAIKAKLSPDRAENHQARRAWEAIMRKPLNWKALNPAESSDGKMQIPIEQKRSLAGVRLQVSPADANKPAMISRIEAMVIPPGGRHLQGRYVRIEIPGNSKILSLAEVQVFSDGKNIATWGSASQSTTDFGGPANLAIDGNTNGDYKVAKSTTHTAISKDPWWQLDLKKSQPLERIVIWNRTDANTSDRLKDFRIAVLDEKQKPIWEQKVSKFPNPSAEFVPGKIQTIEFAAASASETRNGFRVSDVMQPAGTKNLKGWSAEGNAMISLVPKKPITVEIGSVLEISVISPKESSQKYQLEITENPRTKEKLGLPGDFGALLAKPEAERTPEENLRLTKIYLEQSLETQPERNRIAQLTSDLANQKPATTVPVIQELPADRHRTTKIQIRGNYLVTGKEVERGTPSVFPPLPKDAPKNRLTLAHWLVDENNPLTARVIANRFWEKIFGIGLVATSEEFGSQGELPSHAELLDWLATEIIHNGWDMKQFVKMLVMSQTYRQSAQVTEQLFQADPDNRLLARGPRFRMSAEMIRDQALFVSGLLSEKLYGPPVKPPQPNMGVKAAFGSGIDWQTSQGDDKYRRGLYTMWRRSNPYPSMATFDAPNREVCTLRRDRTNTPLQALVTLNDPVYVEAAQSLGRRMATAGKTPVEKVTAGFQMCLARPPAETEQKRLVALYEKAMSRYEKSPDLAKKMASEPFGALPAGANPAEYAALAVVGNVLLNLDEMFMRR